MEAWVIAVIIVAVVIVVFLVIFLSLYYTVGGKVTSSSAPLPIFSLSTPVPPVHTFQIAVTNSLFSLQTGDSGVTINFSVPQGIFTGQTLAAVLEQALGAGLFNVSYNDDARTFTVSATSFQWSLCPTASANPQAGPIYSTIGFAAPPAGCTSPLVTSMTGGPAY